MSQFRPCPFCGGEEIKVDHIKRVVKDADTYRAGCVSCGVGSEENSHQEAVEFWNKRFDDINRKEKIAFLDIGFPGLSGCGKRIMESKSGEEEIKNYPEKSFEEQIIAEKEFLKKMCSGNKGDTK